MAVDNHGPANNNTLNAKAATFEPVGNLATDSYHSASSAAAIATEAAYAAHNYHPLPVVFSRAQGCDVWDPEGVLCPCVYSQSTRQFVELFG